MSIATGGLQVLGAGHTPLCPLSLVALAAQLHLCSFSPLIEDRVRFPFPAPLLPSLASCTAGPHHPHDGTLNIRTWAPGLQMSCLSVCC